MGGASIGAGGVMAPTFRGKGGRGGHNLGIFHISHIALTRLYSNVNALSSLSWRVAHHSVNYFPTGGL